MLGSTTAEGAPGAGLVVKPGEDVDFVASDFGASAACPSAISNVIRKNKSKRIAHLQDKLPPIQIRPRIPLNQRLRCDQPTGASAFLRGPSPRTPRSSLFHPSRKIPAQ